MANRCVCGQFIMNEVTLQQIHTSYTWTDVCVCAVCINLVYEVCMKHHEPLCSLSSPVLPPCNIDAEPDPKRILSSFTIKRLPPQPPPIITILYCNYSSLFNYLDRRLECSHCRCLFRGKRELTWLDQQRGVFN